MCVCVCVLTKLKKEQRQENPIKLIDNKLQA